MLASASTGALAYVNNAAGLEVCANGSPIGINNSVCTLSGYGGSVSNGWGLFTNYGKGWSSSTQPAFITGVQQGYITMQAWYGIYSQSTLYMNGSNLMGGAGTPNQIKGMAAGAVSSASLDAINGSQLYGLASSVAKDLGGGVGVGSNGAITAPKYVVSGGTYSDVGSALAALSSGSNKDAVLYDSSAHDAVTLGGVGVTTPVGLHNVANGVQGNDAVNVAQMTQAVITGNPYVGGFGSGVAASATSIGSVALGLGSVANTPYTISVGDSATGLTRRITNVGTAVSNTDAVNLGQVTLMIGGDQTVFAQLSSQIASLESRASGDANGAAPSSAAAMRPLLGVTDTATTDTNALHYDSGAQNSVTLGGTGATSTVALTNLQNATLSATSTDAVSGQQLYTTNQQVANLNQAVQNISTNGSTGVATNSTSAAAVATGTQSVAVGGGAVAAGANATALGDSANAKASNAVALGANSVADRDNTVSVGAAGSERQIVNVAAGTQGTDAVNMNQLNNAVSQGQQYTDQRIAGVQSQINQVSKNAYAGTAAAMAMPNLTPSGPGRTVVAAGGGYYKGESAAAVGLTYRSANMHWLMNGGVSITSTGDTGVRAQVGYEF